SSARHGSHIKFLRDGARGRGTYAAKTLDFLGAFGATLLVLGLRATHPVPLSISQATHGVHPSKTNPFFTFAIGAFRGLERKYAADSQVGTRLLRIQSVAQRGSHPLFESTTPASSLVNPMPASLLRPGIGTKPRTCPLPDVADHVVQAEGSS